MADDGQHGTDRSFFSDRISIKQVEEGHTLAPKFDSSGLIACVTTHADSGEVLMLGYMNEDALTCTIESGKRIIGAGQGNNSGTREAPVDTSDCCRNTNR